MVLRKAIVRTTLSSFFRPSRKSILQVPFHQ